MKPKSACEEDGPSTLGDVVLGKVDAVRKNQTAASSAAVATTSEACAWVIYE